MSIFQMSIQAGVLIIAIVVIRAIALNKLPKKMFLAFWGVALIRLLIPFSIPSPFSFYSLVGRAVDSSTANIPQVPNITTPPDNIGVVDALEVAELEAQKQVPAMDPLIFVWLIGMVVAIILFCVVYWRGYRELRFATIIRDNAFVDKWLDKHKLLRPITILQSDRLTTPITVGYIKPRIIFPKSMNMSDKHLLSYILTHEYYHIRRFDAVTKLIVTLALCIHWFNPMVWVMVVLINRDLEITCDEMVVRHFGANNKKAYAYSLISMAEQRSKFAPLYSGFSKNATEERITAIMKIKKVSFVSIVVACLLMVGLTTAFATSAVNAQTQENPTEQEDRDANNQSTDLAPSELASYVDPSTGITMLSEDGGITWVTQADFDAAHPEEVIEWWTYDEYKEWLDNEKIHLSEMIGERGGNPTSGWYTWTQEDVDEAIAYYETILADIGNGMLYSKTIDGIEDGNTAMYINQEDIESGRHENIYSLMIDLLNGENATIGPYATIEELAEATKAFCEEQMQNGNLTQTDYDEALAEIENMKLGLQ